MSNKFFAKSLTIWGALITAAPQLAPLVGFDFTVSDAQDVNNAVNGVISAVGVVITVIGRLRAKQGLSLTGGGQ